jgi:hypothetical protein
MPQLPDNGRDLRIGATPGTSGSDAWNRQGATPTGGSNAVLRGPDTTATAAGEGKSEPVPPPAPPAPAHVSSYEQGLAQLSARGVLWHRLDTVAETGETRFTCSLPSRRTPGARRTYEARGRDHLAAIQAVLEQIDKEQ